MNEFYSSEIFKVRLVIICLLGGFMVSPIGMLRSHSGNPTWNEERVGFVLDYIDNFYSW